MATTPIKFHVNPTEPDALLPRFKELICQGIPSLHFKRAELHQNRASIALTPSDDVFYPVTLFATNGFVISISGVQLGAGIDSQPLIDLLHFCEFTPDEETIYAILNCSELYLNLYNKKYL